MTKHYFNLEDGSLEIDTHTLIISDRGKWKEFGRIILPISFLVQSISSFKRWRNDGDSFDLFLTILFITSVFAFIFKFKIFSSTYKKEIKLTEIQSVRIINPKWGNVILFYLKLQSNKEREIKLVKEFNQEQDLLELLQKQGIPVQFVFHKGNGASALD